MTKFRFTMFHKYFGLRILGLLLSAVIVEIILHLVPVDVLNSTISYNQNRLELYQTDARIGWRHKPNATTRYTLDGEFDTQVQINSRGLNDVERPYQKPPGTFRILLLGDSFTEGLNVPIVKGYPRLLEGCLNNHYSRPIEVINSGVAYYSTAEELFFLRHEGLRYEPDLVLVGFFIGNDLDAYAAREINDGWFNSFGGYLIELGKAGQIRKRWIDWQHPSPYEKVSTFEQFLRRFKTYQALAHPDTQFYNWLNNYNNHLEQQPLTWLGNLISTPAQAAEAEDFRKNFSLMIYLPNFPNNPQTPSKLAENWAIIDKLFSDIQTVTNQAEINLGVLILPEKMQASEQTYYAAYHDYASRYGLEIADIPWDYAAPNQALRQLFAEKNIPSFDLLPVYRKHDAQHDAPIYFDKDPHLNEAGHQLTAQAICQWLIESDFVSN